MQHCLALRQSVIPVISRHMPLPQAVQSFLPLVVGLLVGAVGATLFMESMPGAAGSPEERAAKLEAELKQANKRISALEAADSETSDRRGWFGKKGGRGDSTQRGKPAPTFADRARSIAEDIREGRPVNPDDIFRASQPLLRDLAPLFDRMRIRQQREVIDSMSGQLARKYDLTAPQQEALKHWFESRANDEAQRWSALISQDGTRLEDVMRATQDIRPDEGLEQFMQGTLSGEKLETFKQERLAERAERVQQEADRKVQRLDSIVGLDEAQRDQVFGIMARGSRDYDPAMVLEGAGGEIGDTPIGNRQAAMLAVLRPEQRAAYEAEQKRRREEAAKDLEAIGLSLPSSWEMLDEGGFR